MWTDKLKINDDKTEFFIIGSRQQLEKVSVAELYVGDTITNVAPASTARNLGVLFNLNLTFDAQITNTCCTGYYVLSAQYKKDQEILNVGFNQTFGSCTGNGARRLL